MRNMKLLIAGISAAILVTGCGVTQDGFSSNSLQKRKYTKGFYISKRSHLKSKDENSKSEVLVEKDQTSEEAVALLKKRGVKQVSGSEHVVVRQKEDARTTVAESADATKTTRETLVAKEETKIPVSDNSSVRISRDQKKEVKTLLKKQKHESGSSGLADDLQILCIILCFFIPPLAVGIWTNIDWTKVLISLLLTILFFIPGVIYSILVVLDKI
jgi:uncharacterized membrane protein YqaE (UPF0057 family)